MGHASKLLANKLISVLLARPCSKIQEDQIKLLIKNAAMKYLLSLYAQHTIVPINVTDLFTKRTVVACPAELSFEGAGRVVCFL